MFRKVDFLREGFIWGYSQYLKKTVKILAD
jgi:hypothetical protein